MNDRVFLELAEAARRGEPVVLGLISGVKGSSPQKIGAKALFYTDHRITGTLGGGCLEAEAQRLALRALRTGEPATFDLVLDHDFGWDDGLICGGRVFGMVLPNAQAVGAEFWAALAARSSTLRWGVKSDFSIALDNLDHRPTDREVSLTPGFSQVMGAPKLMETVSTVSNTRPAAWLYQETISPPCALWIAGSGHIAQAVAPLARQLDFVVSVFDDRPELANTQFFPGDVSIHVGNWGELCEAPFPKVPAFGLIVTRGHKHDALVLETWIHQPFVFLGMIGSARKARMICDHFIKKKIATAEEVQRVACPVGIAIRSQTVPEIAVSIMAQYIEKRAAVLSVEA
jgi:xanthine dehydrogenase accessory factor